MATEIIGREEELAELRRFLDAADRVPAAFLMEGEPGIGKTVLWRAGVELARARHFRVLTAIPAPAETRLSFAALADLLGPAVAGRSGRDALVGPCRRITARLPSHSSAR